MDDERKRKKFTLYLHPEKAADFQTLEAIESVPRSERGELFRNAFISGMALHQLDPRLPVCKRLVRTVLIFTESSDQLSRATDRVPGLPASPGYVQ